MKRSHVITVLYFIMVIIPCRLNSQVNFFPEGAEWYYAFSGGFIQVSGFTHYVYTGDTTILSRPAKILSPTTYYFDYINPTIPTDTIIREPVYMAQSGDSIFYYATYDSLFQFLWKNDVETGDMFEVPDPWFPYTMTVDSIELLTYDTVEVKKMWISGGTMYGQWGDAIIYDRFGPVGGFNYYGCWGFYDCYDATLCRYRNNAMGQIDFTGAVCDELFTAVENINVTGISVYPNPFEDVFNIDLPSDVIGDVRIEVYNIMGQLVKSRASQNGNVVSVQLEGASDGIYFCKIEFGGKREVVRVMGFADH